jgi:hypothetical protein
VKKFISNANIKAIVIPPIPAKRNPMANKIAVNKPNNAAVLKMAIFIPYPSEVFKSYFVLID